jgi:hypothetical protein
MSTDLVTQNATELATMVENPYEQDPSLVSSVVGTGFLPLLQLATTGDAVKDGTVEMNKYCVRKTKGDYVQLGREVDVIFIQWRPRAMDTSDKANIRVSYDPKSDLWRDIKVIADSKKPNNGCMYGPEYLVYIPEIDTVATFFMGSTTARNESRNTHSLFVNKENKFIGGQGTLKSRQLGPNAAGQKWQAPFCTRCSTPLNQPNQEQVLDILQAFLNPSDNAGAEKAAVTSQVER